MRGFRIDDKKYEYSRILCIQVRIRRTNLDITMTKRKSEKRQTLVKMKQYRNNKLPNVSKEINFACISSIVSLLTFNLSNHVFSRFDILDIHYNFDLFENASQNLSPFLDTLIIPHFGEKKSMCIAFIIQFVAIPSDVTVKLNAGYTILTTGLRLLITTVLP